MPVRINAVLQVYVDDRLANRRGLPQNMPPTKCDAKLKTAVTAAVRKMKSEYAGEVLGQVPVKARGIFGLLGRTQAVDVTLTGFETSWDAKGVMRWKFAWDVPVPGLDIESVRAHIAGGISDGWGESVEQGCRFGEICVVGADSEWRRATPKEKKGLDARHYGRYAVLLTMVGAKFAVVKD